MHTIPFSERTIGNLTYIGTEFAIKRLEKYYGSTVTKEHSTYYGEKLCRFYDLEGKPKALYVILIMYHGQPLRGIVGDSLDMVKWTYREWAAELEAA